MSVIDSFSNSVLLLLKSEVQLAHQYLFMASPISLIMWHSKAMDKGKIEAMATKFSEQFAIIMLKKHRKFCRCGLTNLDAKPIFNKSFRYLWATLYLLLFLLFLDLHW